MAGLRFSVSGDNVTAAHMMKLTDLAEDATETWHCPSCGRIVLLRWNPYMFVVAAEGSEPSAAHAASKTVAATARITAKPNGADLAWLRQHGIAWP